MTYSSFWSAIISKSPDSIGVAILGKMLFEHTEQHSVDQSNMYRKSSVAMHALSRLSRCRRPGGTASTRSSHLLLTRWLRGNNLHNEPNVHSSNANSLLAPRRAASTIVSVNGTFLATAVLLCLISDTQRKAQNGFVERIERNQKVSAYTAPYPRQSKRDIA